MYLSLRTNCWFSFSLESFTSTIRGTHGQGGAGILLYCYVPRSEIPLHTLLHAVCIHLFRVYTVFSLYMTHDGPIAWGDWSELLRQFPKPFLLVSDFNILDPSLVYMVAYPNATMLLSVISDFSLYCLNSGLPKHCYRIDLSFYSSSVVFYFTWSSISSLFGNDHYPILFSEVHPSSLL